MKQRIALTSAGPYVGVTTLAKRIEAHGYQYISMSDILINKFAKTVNATPAYVKAHKAHYRQALQVFGDTSGATKFSGQWAAEMFAGVDMNKPIVIEKVRSDNQARTLADMCFDIVALFVDDELRERNAANFGVSPAELMTIMQHPAEHMLSDLWVDCYYQISDQNMDWLVNRIINGDGEDC